MEKLLNQKSSPNEISPLTLAFIGDGVYDLLVRQYLVDMANRPVGELNKMKVSVVNCKSQAQAVSVISPMLTEKELSVYKRGRNANTKNTPKNGSKSDYHYATGLECLFGYLYLRGESARIQELFSKIISSFSEG